MRLRSADRDSASGAEGRRLPEARLAKALPDGAVVVTLGQCGGEAQVAVTDTGTGISQQFLNERLFRPFETTKEGGMGIGVYEAREYVRALGGRIDVSSTPGGGTTFRVILPLHSAAAAA